MNVNINDYYLLSTKHKNKLFICDAGQSRLLIRVLYNINVLVVNTRKCIIWYIQSYTCINTNNFNHSNVTFKYTNIQINIYIFFKTFSFYLITV